MKLKNVLYIMMLIVLFIGVECGYNAGLSPAFSAVWYACGIGLFINGVIIGICVDHIVK